jgi:hypothetical protein
MPIDLLHAFGGRGSTDNPDGKGIVPFELEGRRIYPIPNVQPPNHVMMGPGDEPPLAGLGPLPTRAAADQRLAEPFSPGEEFVLENMHPEQAELRGTLPSIVCRCFASGDGESGEIPLAFEAVWLFPRVCRGVAVFRGRLASVPDGERALLVAYEHPSAPRSLEHYQNALARRLAGEPADDGDLIPEGVEPSAPAALSATQAMLAQAEAKKSELVAELRDKTQAMIDGLRPQLEAAGVDPDALLQLPEPHDEPPPAPSEAELRATLEIQRAQVEREIGKTLDEAGVDGAAILAQALEPKPGPPPRFSADAELSRIAGLLAQASESGTPQAALQAKVDDPAFTEQLRQAEATLTLQYRHSVTRAAASGETLAGAELAGADLSQLDLSGADLSGAYLECVSLVGAKLAGANLSRAVLAHADLTDADLRGCQLQQASLGRATLTRASLVDADLSGAVLADAVLEGTDRSGAIWPDPIATLKALEAELPPADATPASPSSPSLR